MNFQFKIIQVFGTRVESVTFCNSFLLPLKTENRNQKPAFALLENQKPVFKNVGFSNIPSNVV